MFQSNKNNRGRKNVGSMNKSQTKASRRVVLNWEGGLEGRCMLTTLPIQKVNSVISGRILTVSGTSLSDNIEVRQFGTDIWISSATRDTSRVLSAGVQRFAASRIDTISVSGNDGNDFISVSFSRPIAGLTVKLDGGNGDDQLESLLPNVTMIGGPGNDSLASRLGFATADYSNSTSGIYIDLQGNTCTNDGFGNSDALSNIVNVYGSVYSDTIIGDLNANTLIGNAGDDQIEGRAGNDQLYGGDGNDNLRGGQGNDLFDGGNGSDTADYSFALTTEDVQEKSGVNVDLVLGKASGEGDDQIVNLENINGSDGKDVFNVLAGAKVRGGSGIDIYKLNGTEIAIDGEPNSPLPTNPEITDLIQETFDRFRVHYLGAISGLSMDQQIAMNIPLVNLINVVSSTPTAELSQNTSLGLSGIIGQAKVAWNGGVKKPFDDAVNTGGRIINHWGDVYQSDIVNRLSKIATEISNAVEDLVDGIGTSVTDWVERIGNLGDPSTLAFYGRFIQSFGYLARDIVGAIASSAAGLIVDVLGDLFGELYGRKLTVSEKGVADAVFNGKLKLSRIRIIDEDAISGLLQIGRAHVNGYTVIMRPFPTPVSALIEDKRVTDSNQKVHIYAINLGNLGPRMISTFVHELTHVYQKQISQSPTAQGVREIAKDPEPPSRIPIKHDDNILGATLDQLTPPRDPRYVYTLNSQSTWEDFSNRAEPQAVMVENAFVLLETLKALEIAKARSIEKGTSFVYEISRINPNTVPWQSWELFYSEIGRDILLENKTIQVNSSTRIVNPGSFNSIKKYEGFPVTLFGLRVMYPYWVDHFRIMNSQGFFGLAKKWNQQTRG